MPSFFFVKELEDRHIKCRNKCRIKMNKIIAGRLIKATQRAVTEFFKDNLHTSKTAVLLAVCKTNIFYELSKILEDNNYSEIAKVISADEYSLQFEAAFRLYSRKPTGVSFSIIEKSFRSVVPQSIVKLLVDKVMSMIVDERPYSSEGVTYSGFPKDMPRFNISFMKYSSRISMSKLEAIEFVNTSIKTISGTKEYTVLENIYNNKLGSLGYKRATVFSYQFEAINKLINGNIPDEDFLMWYWENNWIEVVRITGIFEGMHRLLNASGGLVHNAELAFIASYLTSK